MIISHSKKFIFIHGRKTAGSSISISLMRYLSSGDIVCEDLDGVLKYGIKPPDWNKSLLYLRPRDLKDGKIARFKAYRRFVKKSYNVRSAHLSAEQIKELVGKSNWKNYFTFTFERNPYERLISFYFWRTKNIPNPASFKEFLNSIFLNKEQWLKDNSLDGYSNLPFYMIDGEIAVDHVARFENLTSEIKYIYNRIGISFDGWLPVEKMGNYSKETAQKKMYDSESIERMKMIFEKEISLFGYNPET
jgi:hypothetical protein